MSSARWTRAIETRFLRPLGGCCRAFRRWHRRAGSPASNGGSTSSKVSSANSPGWSISGFDDGGADRAARLPVAPDSGGLTGGRMTIPTVLIDLRACQFNGDRGIPAYAQSLAAELVRRPTGRSAGCLLHDPRWPLPGPRRRSSPPTPSGARPPTSTPRTLRDRRACSPAASFCPDHRLRRRLSAARPGCGGSGPRRLGIVYDLVPLLFPDRYLDRATGLAGTTSTPSTCSDRATSSSPSARPPAATRSGTPRSIRLGSHCIYGDIDHRKRALMEQPAAATAGLPARYGLRGPLLRLCRRRRLAEEHGRDRPGLRPLPSRPSRAAAGHRLQAAPSRDRRRCSGWRLPPASPRAAVICTGLRPRRGSVALVRHARDARLSLALRGPRPAGARSLWLRHSGRSARTRRAWRSSCCPNSPAILQDPAADRGGDAARLVDPARPLRERSLGLRPTAARRRARLGAGGRASAGARLLHRRRPPATAGARPARGWPVAVVLPPGPHRRSPPTPWRYLQSDRWETSFYEAGPAAAAGPAGAASARDSRLLPTSRQRRPSCGTGTTRRSSCSATRPTMPRCSTR